MQIHLSHRCADFLRHSSIIGRQVIFVSSDNDDDEFTEYFNEMPW